MMIDERVLQMKSDGMDCCKQLNNWCVDTVIHKAVPEPHHPGVFLGGTPRVRVIGIGVFPPGDTPGVLA